MKKLTIIENLVYPYVHADSYYSDNINIILYKMLIDSDEYELNSSINKFLTDKRKHSFEIIILKLYTTYKIRNIPLDLVTGCKLLQSKLISFNYFLDKILGYPYQHINSLPSRQKKLYEISNHIYEDHQSGHGELIEDIEFQHAATQVILDAETTNIFNNNLFY